MRKWLKDQNRTTPDVKYPKKRRAWRITKKWFNRYQKPRIIGSLANITAESGIIYTAKIINVRILKEGYRRMSFDFTAQPIMPNGYFQYNK